MKLEKMSKTKVSVGSIRMGECFNDNGHYYMKTDVDAMSEDCSVCVDVTSGINSEYENDSYVEPVTAKVVIE